MQFSDVIAQLELLPATYLRPGAQFQQLMNAKAAALFRYTNAVDGLNSQVANFLQSYGVWLDCWGKLWGIPRNNGELDNAYLSRIQATLLSGRTTPVSIELFVQLGFGLSVTVQEDFSTCTWSLLFNIPPTTQQFSNIMASLPFVRPAGVPMTPPTTNAGGAYIGSVNYLGAPRITGAYLETPQNQTEVMQSAYTPNSIPLLPTTFLSDPTLNPSL